MGSTLIKKSICITNADCQISFCNESFESIFHILVDNALRYNRKKKVRIEVDYHKISNFHEIEVSDNGEVFLWLIEIKYLQSFRELTHL